MVIAVGAVADAHHRLAAVGRAVRARVEHVHRVLVLRIRKHVRVVERALANIAIGGDQLPGGACVIRAQEPAVFILHERIHALGVRAAHAHADTPNQPLGHAGVAGDLGPGLTAIDALEESAAGPTARHREFFAVRLPHGGVHDVRVVAVDADVDRGGLVVAIQHLLPRLATVDALVDTTVLVRRRVLAEGGDKDDVGVGRVDADLGDILRLLKADVRPGLAGVGALIDAVAGHDVAADAGLARTDVDDIRVRLAHRHGANRRALDLAVGHGGPVFTAIGGLPETAADGAEVGFLGASLNAADGNRSAAAVGADAAPTECLQYGGVHRAERWGTRGGRVADAPGAEDEGKGGAGGDAESKGGASGSGHSGHPLRGPA